MSARREEENVDGGTETEPEREEATDTSPEVIIDAPINYETTKGALRRDASTNRNNSNTTTSSNAVPLQPLRGLGKNRERMHQVRSPPEALTNEQGKKIASVDLERKQKLEPLDGTGPGQNPTKEVYTNKERILGYVLEDPRVPENDENPGGDPMLEDIQPLPDTQPPSNQTTRVGAFNELGERNTTGQFTRSVMETNPPQLNTFEPSNSASLVEANMVAEEERLAAEEVDLEEKEARRRRDLYRTMAIVLTGLVVLGVVVLLAALFGKKDNGDKNNSLVATEAPTMAATRRPSEHLLTLLPPDTVRKIQQKNDTTQANAYDWMIRDPGLAAYSDARLVQRFALATFYYATDGHNWFINDHWLSHYHHECDWYGGPDNVTTFLESAAEPRFYLYPSHAVGTPCVTNITGESRDENESLYQNLWLWTNGLRGTLPGELGLLTSLRGLFVAANELQGTIPATIGSSRSLEAIDLSTNDLTGSIPVELGLLTSLSEFVIVRTLVTGSIPTQIGNLAKLKIWTSVGNRQMWGPVPSEIGGCFALELFNIGGGSTPFNGTLPVELFQLPQLRWLIINTAPIHGTIPTEVGQLKNLEVLDFFWLHMSGTVPSEIGKLSNLFHLKTQGNLFHGALPSELSLLTSLRILQLNKWNISGPLPSELGRLPLETLWLPSCHLTGTIPTEFGLWRNMSWIKIDDNALTGTLPTQLGQLRLKTIPTELGIPSMDRTRFLVGENDLTGTIPSELGLVEAVELGLGNNHFSGSLPSELGQLSNLRQLKVFSTNISGTIPSSLFGDLTKLDRLRLADNALSGKIATEVGLLTDLWELLLHGNSFTGPMPSELNQLSKLRRFRINDNSLSGGIPTDLGRDWVALEWLNISGNDQLSGTVTDSFCFLESNSKLGFDCSGTLCGCNCSCHDG